MQTFDINREEEAEDYQTLLTIRRSERRKTMSIFTWLQAFTFLLFAYLCIGEFSPRPSLESFALFQAWDTQQIILISLLSVFVAFLAVARYKYPNYKWKPFGGCNIFEKLLLFFNIVPNILAGISICWYCEADDTSALECDYVYTILDSVGVISARLARMDCGIIFLLSIRGEASWLLGVSNGWLGYAEAIPLHRTVGWWCAFQSVLHSLVYFVFYLYNGGWKELWIACFPVDTGDGTNLNRLGLVNFFGVVALFILLPLGVTAMQRIRQRYYHIFQQLHLPLSMVFLVFACLHDLPMLWFAIPGLACWCVGKLMWCRRTQCNDNKKELSSCSPSQLLPGNAKILDGTSGPWVEVNVNVGNNFDNTCLAPIGKWVLMRVVPLGKEMHPLSVVTTENGDLTTIVSANAGDWSKNLANLAASNECHFKVEIEGPFPTGGGHWRWKASEDDEDETLLLIAGGTGLYEWLPGLATASSTGRPCRLIWCVKSEGDYLALKDRLPRVAHIRITVYITRSNGDNKNVELLRSVPFDSGKQYVQSSENRPNFKDNLCLLLTPLIATLTGLLVSYLWFLYVIREERKYLDNLNMMGYIFSWRLLPIIYIIAAIGIVCSVSSIFSRICILRPDVKNNNNYKPILASQIDELGQTHELKIGNRPDLVSIVREVSTNMENQNLVVASCGPTSLVKHVKKAVQLVKKEIPNKDLEFSGTPSHW